MPVCATPMEATRHVAKNRRIHIHLCVYTDKLGARSGSWPLLWAKCLLWRDRVARGTWLTREGWQLRHRLATGVLIVQSSRYCEVKLGNSVDRWCGQSSVIVWCYVIQLCWQIRDRLIKQGGECRVETVKKQSSKMSVNELIAAGERLGYEGDELRQFVREQQAAARNEREAVRALERQAEVEREAVRAAEREAEAARAEAEREARRLKLELQLQIEQVRQNGADGNQRQERIGAPAQVKAPLPKLPKFDESKDHMDAFLERFERFATCQEWPREGWAISISSLLTGKGLQAYAALSDMEAAEYDSLKATLLKCYDLNEEGYRRKFRETKPGTVETASQFVAKLQNFFGRWTEMAKVEKTYEGLRDLMLKEQFLSVCHEELRMFLGERGPEVETIEKLARVAEQYVDAHGSTEGRRGSSIQRDTM